MRIVFLFLLFATVSYAQQVDTFRVVNQLEEKVNFESPFISLGGRTGGKITTTQAKNSCCLIVNREDFKILSFQLTINVNEDVYARKGTGPNLTDEMKDAIGKLRPGSKFIIEEIKTVGPDTIPRKMAPLYFTIK